MSWTHLDPHVDTGSALHRMDSRVKLICWLLLTVCVLTTPTRHTPRHAVFTALLLLLTIAARLPLGYIARRVVPALGFAALAAAGPAFGGSPLLFLSASGRVFLCAWCAVLLTATTEFGPLLNAAHTFGLPPVIVSLTALTWRYVFVIVEEARRTAVGWRCRCSSPSRCAQIRGAAVLATALTFRVVKRAERVERALIARGFDGAIQWLPMPPLRATDVARGCGFALLVLLTEVAA
jgi:cobalt/nickel transport system permease protein